MNYNSLSKVVQFIEYEPNTGDIYLLKDSKKYKKLILDENHTLHTSIYGTRVKIKGNRLIWFVLYKEMLSKDETILHKDLDESNLRQNNLTKIPKKVHYEIIEAMKNLSGALRIIPHPTDAFSYLLEYKKDARIKRETISDISVARKKLLQMQLRLIKFLGKYVVSN